MNPLPVIPENPLNHDVSNILIDEFQEALARPLFPGNIVENVRTYKTEDEFNLKATAAKVQEVQDILDTQSWNLETVERNLMVQQAIYEDKRMAIQDETCAEEKLLMINENDIFEIDDDTAQAYGLIQKKDILPHLIERSLDFRYGAPTFQTKYGYNDKDVLKKLTMGKCKPLVKQARQQLSYDLPEQRTFYSGEDVVEKETKKSKKKEGKNSKLSLKEEVNFILESGDVVFQNCKTGQKYKKTLRIKNVSPYRHRFRIWKYPDNKSLRIFIKNPSDQAVSPGISFSILLTLKLSIARDFEDNLEIISDSGCVLDIPISVKCPYAKLEISLIKSPVFWDLEIMKLADDDVYAENDEVTVICDDCLAGDCACVNLVFTNIGVVDGKYYFMTEEEWESGNIISNGNFISMDNFIIYPRYVHVPIGETATISIVFHPESEGNIEENLMMLSENSTCRKISLKGHGIIFPKNCIKMELVEKLGASPIINDQIIDVTTNGVVFVVENHTSVYVKYYWSARDGVFNCTDHQLETHWLTIKNNVPYLAPYTKNYFKMDITPETDQWGSFTTMVGLYVETIPVYCLEMNEEYIVSHSKYPECDVTGHVDILICEVELVYLTHVAPSNTETLIIENYCVPLKIEYKAEESPSIKFDSRIETFDNPLSDGSLRNVDPALYCIWQPRVSHIQDTPSGFIKAVGESYASVYFDTDNPASRMASTKNVSISTAKLQDPSIDMQISSEIIQVDMPSENLNFSSAELAVHSMNMKDSSKNIQFPRSNQDTEEMFESPKSKIGFKDTVLNLGIIPVGVEFKREIVIQSYTDVPIDWTIYEIMYNRKRNVLCMCSSTNLWPNNGVLKPAKSKTVKYVVKGKKPIRWASLLVLQSVINDNYIMESFCIFAYEKIVMDIRIKTSHPSLPIICPFDLLYPNVESIYQISIENRTLLRGTFEFLQPYGRDVEKLTVEFDPVSGALNKRKGITINVKILPKECGVLDEIYVPCFIGLGQKPIDLRIMIAVDSVHVYFYLPRKTFFDKIKWPKSRKEEYDWCLCASESHVWDKNAEQQPENEAEESAEMLTIHAPSLKTSATSFEVAKTDRSSNTFNTSEIKSAYLKICTAVDEYQPKLTFTESEMSIETEPILETELRTQFGKDIILQENITELINVPLRTPTQFSFYIENVTPVDTSFTVESTNFFDVNREFKKPLNKVLAKLKMKNIEEMWNSSLQKEYGIVITPEEPELYLKSFDVVQVDLWIYANTYGIYMEEIVVSLKEIPAFTFSLLIEIVGIPIEFPFSLNAITAYPTIRFGNIPYQCNPVKRKLKVDNSSELAVSVCFHVFVPNLGSDKSYRPFNLILDMKNEIVNIDEVTLFLLKNRVGKESTLYLEMCPRDFTLEEHSSIEIDLTMHPERFPAIMEKTDVICYILAFVYLKESDRIKCNYYYRKTGTELKNTKIDVFATMELPTFKLDYLEGDTKLELNANDVIFKNMQYVDMRLVFQNNNLSPIHANFHITQPFQVHNMVTSDGVEGKDAIFVNPGKSLEVILRCIVNHEYILNVSDLLYRNCTELEILDMEHNILLIPRNLNIHQLGVYKQHIPVQLFLFYPKLVVEPKILRFDNVLVDSTKKSLLVVKNLSSADVTFEIYKTCPSNVIRTSPNHGRIKKTTGANPEFENVFIYFTPTTTEQVSECIRIVTNIPKYFIDIPVFGNGMYNEKFYVHHHI